MLKENKKTRYTARQIGANWYVYDTQTGQLAPGWSSGGLYKRNRAALKYHLDLMNSPNYSPSN